MGSTLDELVTAPFAKEKQLLGLRDSVPGYPIIPMDDDAAITDLLVRELSTDRLERLYWILFLVSNRNKVDPLHHQLVKRRHICITERPDLHLVWHYDQMMIKPIPLFLLSYDFWVTIINKSQDSKGDWLGLEALGFLRTYSRLIAYESDFLLAKKYRLLPDHITWEGWCHFIQAFRELKDREVAKRYHYGEIRLTRLNLWHTILHGCSFLKVRRNYTTYFAQFGAPYLFIFGAATVTLTALQTAVEAFPEPGSYHAISARFVPFTLVLTLIGMLLLPLLFLFFWAKELFKFVFYHRHLS